MKHTLQAAAVGWLLGALATGHATAAEAPQQSPVVPGVVIDYRPASTGQYLGSPSLAILTNGDYVVSHDFFGPGSTLDRTAIFASSDRGKTWTKISDLEGQWWSSLFLHRGALYLMGTSRENGFAVIRRSVDGGRHWTRPQDPQSGLLLADGRYHCAPVPVVAHRGRLWRAMEDAMGPGGWGTHFHSFMMSAPEDADLLNATNWLASSRLGGDPKWLGAKFGGWLEGNAVIDPHGAIVNILRVDFRDSAEKAAMVRISADGRTARFDPNTDFIDFPGGCKKFSIRRDPKGSLYWSLSNYVPEQFRNGNPERTRNTLALVASADLRQWEVRAIILQNPDLARHGFQYADWQFEENDLAVVSRTAHEDGLGGAHNQHDSNYITFHRLLDFRTRRLGAADR